MEDNLQKRFETTMVATGKLIKEVLPVIGVNGDFKQVFGKDAICTQIRNLLMTPLGTYPFDPNYGSLLYKQLFEPMNDVTENQIYYEVRDRIMQYVEGVTVESVNVDWKVKNKACTIDVYLYILDEENRTKLSLDVKNSVNNNMYGSIDDPDYGDFTF